MYAFGLGGSQRFNSGNGNFVGLDADQGSVDVKKQSFYHKGDVYKRQDRDYVLDNVSLVIPEHKVTAIGGASGSGKTTLVKLMLGFYSPNKGAVKVGDASRCV